MGGAEDAEETANIQTVPRCVAAAVLRGISLPVPDLDESDDFFSTALLLRFSRRTGDTCHYSQPGGRTVITVHKSPRRRRTVNTSAFRLSYRSPRELAAMVATVGINAPQLLQLSRRVRGLDSFIVSGCGGTSVELAAPSNGPDTALDPDSYIASNLDREGRQAVSAIIGGADIPAPASILTQAQLQVNDLRKAVDFFDCLGFSVLMQRLGGAVLTNGTQEIVLRPSKRNTIGLSGLRFNVGDTQVLDSIARSLAVSGHHEPPGASMTVKGPGGADIILEANA